MKLNEIFDTQITSKALDAPFTPNDGNRYEDQEALGVGHFSRAFKDPDDPHMIDKEQIRKSYQDRMADGFEFFAKKVIKNKLWNEIHFPRIYVENVTTDKTGKKNYKWKMEKLIPLTEYSDEGLHHLAEQYFGEDNAIEINSGYTLASAVQDAVHGYIKIRDEQLMKALKILKELYKEYFELTNGGGFWDMHAANMMIRRTSVGPQLVITDPFASSNT